MKTSRRVLLFLTALLTLQTVTAYNALAQKETCKQCKFAGCIRSAIKQKEAMRDAYSELAKKWEKFWVNTDKGMRTPLDQVNLQKLYPTARILTLGLLNSEFTQLRKDEEELATRVGAPAGCGYSPTENLEMETDSIKCSIDMLKARKAEDASPCKELYEIAFRHEALHMQKCQQRKGNKALPAVMLTPAGKAREEAAAYAQEIAELKKLLKCKSYQASGQFLRLVISGLICDIEKPFTLKGKSMLDFTFKFTPSSASAGSVVISMSGYGGTGAGSGSYTIQGIETENPKMTVIASYTGRFPPGSAMGSGPLQIDLVPLETSECDQQ
ncbi:MAG: hypothetical protein U1F66_09810 [bacterium]